MTVLASSITTLSCLAEFTLVGTTVVEHNPEGLPAALAQACRTVKWHSGRTSDASKNESSPLLLLRSAHQRKEEEAIRKQRQTVNPYVSQSYVSQ